MIEQFKKILAFFPENDESVLYNIEEVACIKWRNQNDEVERIANAMVDQFNQEKREAQKYANENAWDYQDVLSWLYKEFGPLAKMAMMFNRYNGQVCNGGHQQYYDNGYASQGGGLFEDHGDDTTLHDEFVALFEQYAEIPSHQIALRILKDFELTENLITCESCDGAGEHDEEDEDGDIVDTYSCDECRGDGEIEDGYRVLLGNGTKDLDSRWYAFNDQVETELGALFSKYLGIVDISGA